MRACIQTARTQRLPVLFGSRAAAGFVSWVKNSRFFKGLTKSGQSRKYVSKKKKKVPRTQNTAWQIVHVAEAGAASDTLPVFGALTARRETEHPRQSFAKNKRPRKATHQYVSKGRGCRGKGGSGRFIWFNSVFEFKAKALIQE